MQLANPISLIKGVKFLNVKAPKYKKGTLMIAHDTTYGRVIDVKEKPYFQVKIDWCEDEDSVITDKIWYTEEMMAGCRVKALPLIIPGETIIKFPKDTSVLLEDESIHVFDKDEMFFVQEATGIYYLVVSPDAKWLLPIDNFPGIPILCLITKERQQLNRSNKLILDESKSLKAQQDKLESDIFMYVSDLIPDLFSALDSDCNSVKNNCLQKFNASDVEDIFTRTWSDRITYLKKEYGVGLFPEDRYPFREGDRIIKSQLNPDTKRGFDYWFGTISGIQIYPLTISVTWDRKDQYNDLQCKFYSVAELYEYGIEHLYCQVLEVGNQANRHIAFEFSRSEAYFSAAFGFSSKEKAKTWLKVIKRKIGQLSQRREDLQGFGNPNIAFEDCRGQLIHKYFHVLESPKHKTFNGFYRNLCKLFDYDFSHANKDYYRNRTL